MVVLLFVSGCKITYGFTGGSLDYSKYKSISIVDFPNNAELVNPTLSQFFTEALKDKYTRSTKLMMLRDGGDMHLEGEIVGYQLQAMAISADSYASETKLTLTINVRFTDTKNPITVISVDKTRNQKLVIEDLKALFGHIKILII